MTISSTNSTCLSQPEAVVLNSVLLKYFMEFDMTRRTYFIARAGQPFPIVGCVPSPMLYMHSFKFQHTSHGLEFSNYEVPSQRCLFFWVAICEPVNIDVAYAVPYSYCT